MPRTRKRSRRSEKPLTTPKHTRSSFYKLSRETLERIVSFLDPHLPAERHDLCELTLTCRSLRAVSQKRVWSEIQLVEREHAGRSRIRRIGRRNVGQRAKRLTQILKSNSRIAPLIRKLYLNVGPADSHMNSLLSQETWIALVRLINHRGPLTDLTLKADSADRPWRFLTEIRKSRKRSFLSSYISSFITHLTLVNIRNISISMIATCTRLEVLRLDNVELDPPIHFVYRRGRKSASQLLAADEGHLPPSLTSISFSGPYDLYSNFVQLSGLPHLRDLEICAPQRLGGYWTNDICDFMETLPELNSVWSIGLIIGGQMSLLEIQSALRNADWNRLDAHLVRIANGQPLHVSIGFQLRVSRDVDGEEILSKESFAEWIKSSLLACSMSANINVLFDQENSELTVVVPDVIEASESMESTTFVS